MLDVLVLSAVAAATAGLGAFVRERSSRKGRGPLPLVHPEADEDRCRADIVWDADFSFASVAGPALNIAYGAASHAGCVRPGNEDALLAMPNSGLYAVADGLGGHAAGGLASMLVVEALQVWGSRPHAPAGPLELARRLGDAFGEVNMILHRAGRSAAFANMGSTLVAAQLGSHNRVLVVGNAGDSRCYRQRDGVLAQLTQDHLAWVNGVPTNALIRAIGPWQEVTPSLGLHGVRPGDAFLLCSDGLTRAVPDSTIDAVLSRSETPQVAAEALVESAIQAGGPDNVTAVVLRASTR